MAFRLQYGAGAHEFRVPLILKLGRLEIPVGLSPITLVLFATAIINLFTKQVATVSGVAFTVLFFGIFTASEKMGHRLRPSRPDLGEFHLVTGEEISLRIVGRRPGNILVPIRDYHTLYNLDDALRHPQPRKKDVVVLQAYQVARAGSGEHPWYPNSSLPPQNSPLSPAHYLN
jgi:hypothetical protein